MAWDEFKLPDFRAAPGHAGQAPRRLTPRQNDAHDTHHWAGLRGGLRQAGRRADLLAFPGRPVGRSPLRPDFWRAQIDNDRGRNMLKSQGIWREAHEGAEVRSMTVQENPQSHAWWSRSLPALPKVEATWETDYTVYGTGDVVVEAHFKPNKTDLPKLVRLGMQMTLPAGFERLTWLGPGPQETYCDRKDAKFGLYSGNGEDQFYADYTKPGESGNKADVRWLALANGQTACWPSSRSACRCSAPTRCITAPRI